MIRLGGVVGYAFEGPFPLSEWVAPSQGAVWAILLGDARGRYAGQQPAPGNIL